MKLINYKKGQHNSQADPYVLKGENGKYYLYVTGCDGVHAYQSDSLTSEYSYIGIVFNMSGKEIGEYMNLSQPYVRKKCMQGRLFIKAYFEGEDNK